MQRPGFLVLLFFSLFAPFATGQELTEKHRAKYAECRSLQQSGDWQGARKVAEELVSAFENAAPSQYRLAFTNELANLDQRLGNYDQALSGYRTCLDIASAISGPESKLASQLKNNLAALHQVLGNFAEAENLNREALAIRQRIEGESSAETVPALNNLAGLLWCIGDLPGAEKMYREALSIRTNALGPNALDTARSQANLGGLLFYRNEISEAEPLVRQATATFDREAGPTHPDTLEVLLFLGEIERALGNHESALTLYSQVTAGRIESLGTEAHVEVAESTRREGDALRSLGRYAEATEKYQKSETIYDQLLRAQHPDRLEGVYGLGLAAFASGDNPVAKQAAQTCSDIEFHEFEAILQFTDERQRLAFQDVFRSHHLFANLQDGPAVAEFLLRKKGVVVDSLIAESQLMKTSPDPAVNAASAALSSARARFRSAFLAGGNDTSEIEASQAAVQDAHRALLDLTGGSVGFAGLTDYRLSDLQAALQPGEVLIDYLKFDHYSGNADFTERYGAAIVTSSTADFVECADAAEVDALVAEIIPFFASMEPDDNLARTVLTKLYDLLVAPYAPRISQQQTVIICPESSLSFVPFAGLLTSEGTFLIEQHDVAYVSSARELIASQPVAPGNGALLIGNPKFQSSEISPIPVADNRGLLTAFGSVGLSNLAANLLPLSGAELEVQELSSIIGNMGIPSQTIIGTEATESNVKGNISRPAILHLATHGVYLPAAMPPVEDTNHNNSFVPDEVAGFQNPMFGSWLALTGSKETVSAWATGIVPNPDQDGILMANEAAELDLEGTTIVTLSACETASGEATAGDGVLGIRRGFRLAGAQNVLTTLWPIADAVTVEIMKQFYTGLGQTSPAQSLSQTQREWLVKIRDNPAAVTLPDAAGNQVPVGGLYWSINLAGPFLLSR